MANLALITDEQAELINGGHRWHRRSGGIKLYFPNLTSITAPVVIYINSNDNSFTVNPA